MNTRGEKKKEGEETNMVAVDEGGGDKGDSDTSGAVGPHQDGNARNLSFPKKKKTIHAPGGEKLGKVMVRRSLSFEVGGPLCRAWKGLELDRCSVGGRDLKENEKVRRQEWKLIKSTPIQRRGNNNYCEEEKSSGGGTVGRWGPGL